MTDSTLPKYVDHPAPSPVLILALIVVVGIFLVSVPDLAEKVSRDATSGLVVAIVAIAMLSMLRLASCVL